MHKGRTPGFTIVELLIVIVVIGILAAISFVAYNGLTSRSNDAAVRSDLATFNKKVSLVKAENGTYPATLTQAMGIKFSRNAYGLDEQLYNVRYCYNSTTDAYIIYARSKSGNFFKYTSTGGLEVATNTYGWGVCSQIGLVNTNPTQNGIGDGTGTMNWDNSWIN